MIVTKWRYRIDFPKKNLRIERLWINFSKVVWNLIQEWWVRVFAFVLIRKLPVLFFWRNWWRSWIKIIVIVMNFLRTGGGFGNELLPIKTNNHENRLGGCYGETV